MKDSKAIDQLCELINHLRFEARKAKNSIEFDRTFNQGYIQALEDIESKIKELEDI